MSVYKIKVRTVLDALSTVGSFLAYFSIIGAIFVFINASLWRKHMREHFTPSLKNKKNKNRRGCSSYFRRTFGYGMADEDKNAQAKLNKLFSFETLHKLASEREELLERMG